MSTRLTFVRSSRPLIASFVPVTLPDGILAVRYLTTSSVPVFECAGQRVTGGRLNLSRETWIAWQSRGAFRALLRRADLYLDTIGFSGFNTAVHALECGLPIVTREGRFMRGRLASGPLRHIGLPELVAPTDEAYVELAVALAGDRERRKALRARIEAGRARLYRDAAPLDALQRFIENS